MSGVKHGRRRAAEWGALIREQAASGEEAAAFCRRRGISLATFRWWRWRFGVESRGGAAERQSERRRARPGATSSSGFAPVRLVERSSMAAGEFDFEVCLAGGRRVRVRRGFEAEGLARLLSVLEASGC